MMYLKIDKATFFDKLLISVLSFLGCVFSFVCHRPVSCVSLDCPFLSWQEHVIFDEIISSVLDHPA
jgi:hypothetical protein